MRDRELGASGRVTVRLEVTGDELVRVVGRTARESTDRDVRCDVRVSTDGRSTETLGLVVRTVSRAVTGEWFEFERVVTGVREL